MSPHRPRRRFLALTALAVTAVLVTTACGGPDEPTAAPPSGAPAQSGAPVPSDSRTGSSPGGQVSSPEEHGSEAPADATGGGDPSTATGTVSPKPDQEPVTISFVGDMHFEGELRSRLDDPRGALAPISGQLAEADLTVANLESAVGTGGDPEPKRYLFQAPPAAFDALAAAGVDVVTMANNHAMDYGSAGLAETFDARRRAAAADPPLSVVGIGGDRDDAFAAAVHDVGGTTVAVIGASTPDDPTADPTEQWAATENRPGVAVALDPEPLLDAVEAAQRQADVVVVYMHWGVQGDACPSDSQTELATELAAAGADVVAGSHTHQLQGAGMLDSTYVAYGLGNFAWYTQSSEATSTTGVLTLTVADGHVTRESWAPATIQPDGLPEFASGARAERMREEFTELRECTNLQPLNLP
ncbi:CapA family protein [Phytoactinopolyspora halotolerans]|uniref:CapA family protein n=1 Tax=Phytoactinopolyspora halotolerans TaxID=1981512 RepID=A0A6L9S4K8_9ACTN|nr:CapA family protein [Phytoactinopolyspora halotolerans]NED99700.1 CapA family protein [Phytoactinopolyspora halotolerans]